MQLRFISTACDRFKAFLIVCEGLRYLNCA